MLCTNGHPNDSDAKFCSTCGINTFDASTTQQSVPTYVPSQQANAVSNGPATAGNASGLATASLVTGILGILILPVLFSLAALITARLAMRTLTKGAKGYGMAMAGQILGAIGLVWFFITLAASR
jgi:hypothetical protein